MSTLGLIIILTFGILITGAPFISLLYASYVIDTNTKLKAYIIDNFHDGMTYIDKPSFVRRVRGIQNTTGWIGCTPIYDKNKKRCVIYNDGVSYESAKKLLDKNGGISK